MPINNRDNNITPGGIPGIINNIRSGIIAQIDYELQNYYGYLIKMLSNTAGITGFRISLRKRVPRHSFLSVSKINAVIMTQQCQPQKNAIDDLSVIKRRFINHFLYVK
jgi:hypothetical protein